MSASPHHPQRHAITAVEYLRMAEAGVFAASSRLELMEGEIIDMAPIGSRHAAVVNTLAGLLGRWATDRAIVSVQNPLIVDERSVPQPDVMLLRSRADQYFNAHPVAADVLLVVEVSDSSLRFDREIKIPSYARAGISEAWLIDLEKRAVHVFNGPGANGYTGGRLVQGAESIGIPGLPDVTLTPTMLFPA